MRNKLLRLLELIMLLMARVVLISSSITFLRLDTKFVKEVNKLLVSVANSTSDPGLHFLVDGFMMERLVDDIVFVYGFIGLG